MLTAQEIETLIEAVDCWEKEAGQKALMGTMLTAMLVRDEETAQRMHESESMKAERLIAQRKRASILLKAKLVQMLDELAPSQLFSNVVVGKDD